jgi:DNA-binding transcriptional regulator LsrR (DeoR family)
MQPGPPGGISLTTHGPGGVALLVDALEYTMTAERKSDRNPDPTRREELLVQAAWMYYYDDMTQQQIATKLGISRIKVTRLLQEARSNGVVEIKLLRPLPAHFEISHQLERTFRLKQAVVVSTAVTREETLKHLGRATAAYLASVAPPRSIIGFGYSRTVGHVADFVDLLAGLTECQIVDLIGCNLGQPNPYSISAKIADALSLPVAALTVPVVVASDAAYRAIVSDPNIKQTLGLAARSAVALIGLGDVSLHNTLFRGGYLATGELEHFRERGVVGDVLLHCFDIDGRPIRHELDRRIIGLTWDQIETIPQVIAVATGPTKVAPILGFVRSGLCGTLITDAQTASAVLDQHHARPTRR